MKKLIRYVKVWKVWNEKCYNKPFYKILVFLGIVHSPSFNQLKGGK